MRKFTLLCLLFVHVVLYGQNRTIDSLNILISNASSDTARINLLLKKVYVLSDQSLDSAIVLGNRIAEEAKRIGYQSAYGRALTSLTSYYSFTGDFVTATRLAKEGEAVLLAIKDQKHLGMHYNAGYGILYGIQSKYDSAGIYFLKAIAIGQSTKDSVLLSGAWQNIAIGYYMQSNFLTAISYQQKALNYYELKHDLNGEAKVLMNMGNAYNGAEDTRRAKQAYYKTIAITQKIGNLRTQLYAFKNLAEIMSKEGKPDSVYTLSVKAAGLAKIVGDKSIEASCMSLAAEALAKKYRFEEADSLNNRAIALADSAGLPFNIYQVYATKGTIYRMQDKYIPAIGYFEKAFSKLKGLDFYETNIADNYQQLSRCYENTGNPLKALEAYKIYTSITDSIRKKDNVQKITELNLNYEFTKKQEEADIEQQKKTAAKNAQQTALLVILGATLVLAIAAFVGYRNKQKANQLLNQQKEEIQTTLTQLKATQAQLIQSEKMASLGELTAGIAHEIQNPLNFVNNFSEISAELAEELRQETGRLPEQRNAELETEMLNDIRQNMEKINHHGKRAAAIVKGMLQHSGSGSGNSTVKEPVRLNALTEEYMRLAYHGFRVKEKTFSANLQTDFDPLIEKINIVPQDIGRVVLNLITNAFYAVAEKKKAMVAVTAGEEETVFPNSYEPTVIVKTKRTSRAVILTVQDNGNGIPARIIEKIFQPFFTTKPTGQGTGLGLSLAYDIIKAHGGELKVETNEGEGASFFVHLPLS